MKILIVGGTGTLGEAIVKELQPRHHIIVASHTHADLRVDITDTASIASMYEKVGKVDAIITAAGKVPFIELTKMTSADYLQGLNNKLMGQVNVVLLGLSYLNDQGSFTLTSGILNQEPIRLGSAAAMVNGAIDSFVKAAAIEMPRGIRINTVSPTVVIESLGKLASHFRGYDAIPVAKAALAYSKSVEGLHTGQVYRVGYSVS